MSENRGIGLIELLLALVVLGLLAVITVPQVARYQASRDLRHAGRLLSGDLRLTQQYAVTQDENFGLVYSATPVSEYSIIRLSDGTVVRKTQLPDAVTVSGSFAATPAEFAPTGAPAQAGEFCLTDGNSTLKISVLVATGRVEQAEVTPCP